MWRKIYFCLLCFRFYLVFQPQFGYIHPDEFFQGPEKIAGDVFRYEVHTTWEFDESFPVRSPFIWYLLCGYPFSIVRVMKLTGVIKNLDSYWLLVAPRFLMTLLSFLTDSAMMRIGSALGCPPYMVGCLSATSFVTVIFYTRTFSNSLEAFFFAILLVCTSEYIHLSKMSTILLNKPIANQRHDTPEKETNVKSGDKSETEAPQPPAEHEAVPVTTENGPVQRVPNDHSDAARFDSANAANGAIENSDVTQKSKMGELIEKHTLSSTATTLVSKPMTEEIICRDERLVKNRHSRNKTSLLISVIIVAGVWNRPTFLGFAIVPVLYWLFEGRMPRCIKDVLMAIGRALSNLPYIMNSSLIFILFDTSYYRAKNPLTDYNIVDQFIVTPLNFLVYNRNSDNLAEHGVHPRYLHILLNAPLLFGPLTAFIILFLYLAFCITNQDHKKVLLMLFFSMLTPLFLLSIFPHQEARFIIPLLVPCVLIAAYSLNLIQSKLLYTLFFLFWIPHNLFLGYMFGFMHQAGVVPSMFYLNKQKTDGALNGGATLIYHRTYMPPKSLLQIHSQDAHHIRLIDLQGRVDDMNLDDELMQYDSFYFVTPYQEPRLNMILGDGFSLEKEASFFPHLTMEDPPDLDDLMVYDKRNTPNWEATVDAFEKHLTLNIYRVTNKRLIVQTFPSSGDSRSTQQNIEAGAYDIMAITLPKAKCLSM